MADDSPISIAYIGGSPRSGSTVLAHLTAQVLDGVVVGELKDIWYRGPLENQRCSCGQLFRACDFWVDVGRRAFGGWDTLPLQRLAALQRRIDRFRTLPLLLAPELTRRRDPAFHGELCAYRETLTALYRAVLASSGRSFVVESSKHPAQAFVLSASDALEPKVIHLVRDSRGVAWSFQKQVVRPEVADGRLMPQAVPAKAAWQWMLNNLPFHLLWTRGVPQLTIRYESYTREPLRALEEIGHLLGRPNAPRSAAELQIDFATEHSLGGNPVRFSDRSLDLRIDEEWRSAMRRPDRLRVGAITLPLLAAYGYVGRGRS